MAEKKVHETRNYRMFRSSIKNREVDLVRHKELEESMTQDGFDPARHIVCKRNTHGELEVMIGQNRLAMAEKLGLPVWYMIGEVDIDPAKDDRTQIHWKIRDYAKRYVATGKADYQEALDFADQHAFALSDAAALLNGTTGFSHIHDEFYSGAFTIKDRAWANAVASLHDSLVRLNKDMRGHRLLTACMAVCRIPAFSSKRLLQGAQRCQDELRAYANRDNYLEMMELLYNFGRPLESKVPLKLEASRAMRERNPACAKKAKREGGGSEEVNP